MIEFFNLLWAELGQLPRNNIMMLAVLILLLVAVLWRDKKPGE